jgi:LPXTG-motif cell wall-anchored protein
MKKYLIAASLALSALALAPSQTASADIEGCAYYEVNDYQFKVPTQYDGANLILTASNGERIDYPAALGGEYVIAPDSFSGWPEDQSIRGVHVCHPAVGSWVGLHNTEAQVEDCPIENGWHFVAVPNSGTSIDDIVLFLDYYGTYEPDYWVASPKASHAYVPLPTGYFPGVSIHDLKGGEFLVSGTEQDVRLSHTCVSTPPTTTTPPTTVPPTTVPPTTVPPTTVPPTTVPPTTVPPTTVPPTTPPPTDPPVTTQPPTTQPPQVVCTDCDLPETGGGGSLIPLALGFVLLGSGAWWLSRRPA